jgi:flagellar biosynthetic protein FliR
MDFGAVARFGVLLVRPGALMLLAPGFAGQSVPVMTRIALTALLAISLAPAVTIAPGPDAGIVLTVAREFAIGMALGMTARALMAGAEFAGHLCSQQIGLSYAATINPDGGARNTVLATLYGLIAVLVWLGIDGHHLLLKALSASYEGLPIGAGHLDASLAGGIRQVLGVVFVTGLRLAAPVMAILLVVELAFGLISRAAPALNVFISGTPVRLVVGLFVVGTTIAALSGVVRSMAPRVVTLGLELASAFR